MPGIVACMRLAHIHPYHARMVRMMMGAIRDERRVRGTFALLGDNIPPSYRMCGAPLLPGDDC